MLSSGQLAEELEACRRERDEAIALNSQLQQQLDEAQTQITQLQIEIRDAEGVAEQWSMVAEEAEERIDRIAAERDQAQRERDEAQTQITQLQEQLAADQLRQQLEAGAPGAGLDLVALQAMRDRILARTRSDKLKAVREALDQLLSSIQGRARN